MVMALPIQCLMPAGAILGFAEVSVLVEDSAEAGAEAEAGAGLVISGRFNQS